MLLFNYDFYIFLFVQLFHINTGKKFRYKKLCICTGGTPKVISKDNPFVVSIRDTESVKNFQERMKNARRIAVVGNGGIATEIVYEITGKISKYIWRHAINNYLT